MAITTTTTEQIAIQIVQKAYLKFGVQGPEGFDDNTAEGHVASELYEDEVQGAISDYPWSFTLRQRVIRKTDTPEIGIAYAIPETPDMLSIQAVRFGITNVRYDRQGNTVVVDRDYGDTLVLWYQIRLREDQWPPYFKNYVIARLSTVFAGAVSRSASMIKAMSGIEEVRFARAKVRDAQGQTNRKADLSLYRRRRRGGFGAVG
jgi:hypothetical protein